MLLLGKVALSFASTLAVAGAYTFHEGVIRVDVDEAREDGSHIHFWVPATIVPIALRFVPQEHLRDITSEAAQWLPVARACVKELKNYPDAQFVDVRDHEQHVQIATRHGKLQIDAETPDEKVHVTLPIETLNDVARQLASRVPAA